MREHFQAGCSVMSEGDGSDERQFLHDLASPLGTALFVADALLESLQGKTGRSAGDLLQAGEIYQALMQLKKLLEERRQILIKRGVPSARK